MLSSPYCDYQRPKKSTSEEIISEWPIKEKGRKKRRFGPVAIIDNGWVCRTDALWATGPLKTLEGSLDDTDKHHFKCKVSGTNPGLGFSVITSLFFVGNRKEFYCLSKDCRLSPFGCKIDKVKTAWQMSLFFFFHGKSDAIYLCVVSFRHDSSYRSKFFV